MATVDQLSKNPTNKLTAATVAAAILAIIGLVIKNEAPGWYDPEVMLLLSPIAAFLAGYVIRDRPNVPK